MATCARGATATSSADARTLLERGAVTLLGQMPWASNATFLVECALEGDTARAVYKPGRGERPLWDFPRRLYRREIAAYLLSEALGWSIVPLTLEREGPYGEGSLQAFVDADFEQHYFTLVEKPENHEALKRICAFDLVANNADRKSGHCLLGPGGTIHGVDNGLCFHVEPKLRTVIWEFGGEPIPDADVADVRSFVDTGLPDELAALLSADEQKALLRRARAVVKAGCFPENRGGRSYPWPLV